MSIKSFACIFHIYKLGVAFQQFINRNFNVLLLLLLSFFNHTWCALFFCSYFVIDLAKACLRQYELDSVVSVTLYLYVCFNESRKLSLKSAHIMLTLPTKRNEFCSFILGLHRIISDIYSNIIIIIISFPLI